MGNKKMDLSESKLYQRIIDCQNIYYSIFSLDSYIFEKELLSKEDYKLMISLRDKFNINVINKTISEVKKLLKRILLSDEFLTTEVYFRPKKVKKTTNNKYINSNEIVFRPLHVSPLNTQIAIASILNAILLVKTKDKLELSEIGRVFPNNFYGNIPSENPKYLFHPWQKKYKEYSNVVRESYSRYLETKEYSHEIMIDLENFFPSIQPMIVYKKIINMLKVKYSELDLKCLKIALLKLLYMKVSNEILPSYYQTMEKKYTIKTNFTQGIPQGLPQSYFFGNICMLEIADLYKKHFEGNAYFYVDDSVVYTNIFKGKSDLEVNTEFKEKLANLNRSLSELNCTNEECDILLSGTDLNDVISQLNSTLSYNIKAHDTNSKSEISEIDNEKIGSPNLSILGKIASLSAFELRTTFDDFEELTLENKFYEFKRSIEKEIKRIDDKCDKEKYANYRKYLPRFCTNN